MLKNLSVRDYGTCLENRGQNDEPRDADRGGITKAKKITFPYVSKKGQHPCQHFDFMQLRFILNFCQPVIHLDYVLIW